MVKSLGCSIINMYSMGACAALGISNQDALSEDLENDLFLNSGLQRFTCELYYRFGSFLAPLSIGIITSGHYLSEHDKNGGTSGTSGDNEDEQKFIWSRRCEAPHKWRAHQPRVSVKALEPRKRSYWIFYRYGYGGFLLWNWTHFSC